MDFAYHDTFPVKPRLEVRRAPSFFNWRQTYPDLKLLLDNVDIIRREMNAVVRWTPWPEQHLDSYTSGEWTVFPFFHTFPACDTSTSTWIQSTSEHCPRTVELLKQIPELRTALFSKLGPLTKLSHHTGWSDLANYVLRCHIPLVVPNNGKCGLIVEGETRETEMGSIIVFDDSKKHGAFNESPDSDRVVLIVDILRPPGLPLGTATGGHTKELDAFVDMFR